MTPEPAIEVTVDRSVNAGYLRLSANPVHSTEALTDDVLVDLDEMGVVVGVEVLSLSAEIPIDTLISVYHVRSEVAVRLKSFEKSLTGFTVSSGSEASSRTPGSSVLAR